MLMTRFLKRSLHKWGTNSWQLDHNLGWPWVSSARFPHPVDVDSLTATSTSHAAK